MSDPAWTTQMPYVVVETDEERQQATGMLLRRWVIMDGRGEIVSLAVSRKSAFAWCAALMWWLTVCVEHVRKSTSDTPRHSRRP